jgi:hypothetical protein
MTVRGWTKASTSRHPGHKQVSHDQNTRSLGRMYGLGTERW